MYTEQQLAQEVGSTKKVGREMEEIPEFGPRNTRDPAQVGGLKHRRKLHTGLRKAESSLAIQLRTEKVGVAAFLYARRVPGVVSPAWPVWLAAVKTQSIFIVFCPNHTMATRNKIYEEAGT